MCRGGRMRPECTRKVWTRLVILRLYDGPICHQTSIESQVLTAFMCMSAPGCSLIVDRGPFGASWSFPSCHWRGQIPGMDSSFTVNYYVHVSVTTLFTFDYFCQLEDEVTFIWSRRDWSVGKVLFVLTRYIPFIIIPLILCAIFATNLDVHTCETLLYITTILEIVAITLSEVIFGLRAYAMWNRNRAVLVTYCCVAIVYVAVVVFMFQSFLPSVTFGESPIATISGCYKTSGNSLVFATFVVIMLVEVVTTALTLYPAFQHFRHTPNSLSQNMARGGVFYCVTMFSTCMSVANVLLILLFPVRLPALPFFLFPHLYLQIQYGDMFTIYQTVMHTVLATRMQLHLRKVDQHTYLVDRFAEESLVQMSFMRSTCLSNT
ncbi:hypothetical protein BDN67DRAFT_1006190 [Paxillus ammoniavirescens]|nr:hypothetical protein BDN67DRAFT_1006190 [Paxillus ammoniavirescens]